MNFYSSSNPYETQNFIVEALATRGVMVEEGKGRKLVRDKGQWELKRRRWKKDLYKDSEGNNEVGIQGGWCHKPGYALSEYD